MSKRAFSLQSRMRMLRNQILECNEAYYNAGASILPDFKYDELSRELEELEELFHVKQEERISNQIGSVVGSGKGKIQHHVPMLSLSNCYSMEEMEKFYEGLRMKLGEENGVPDMIAELKYDGIAVSIKINPNGKHVVESAATRGNGSVGMEITTNFRAAVGNLTAVEEFERWQGPPLHVRGELVMSRNVYGQRKELGLGSLGNVVHPSSRNLVAGLMNRQSVSKGVELDFVAYGAVLEQENLDHIRKRFDIEVKTQSRMLDVLDLIGFETSKRSVVSGDFQEIRNFIDQVERERSGYGFDSDGVVVKVNDFENQERIGYRMKSPKWAIAFKFAPERASAKLLNVENRVGRTGRVTPVAVFEPVELSGAVLNRASLHNHSHWRNLGIDIGDIVEVTRSAEIIPQIVGKQSGPEHGYFQSTERWQEWLKEQRCGCHLRRKLNVPEMELDDLETQSIALQCDQASCQQSTSRRVTHFAQCMGISGFGEPFYSSLVESDLIHGISDVFSIVQDEDMIEKMTEVKGIGATGVASFAKQVDELRRDAELFQIIHGLGIPGVGKKTAQMLAKEFGSLQRVVDASEGQVMEIPRMGEKMANNIVQFFQDAQNLKEIDRLQQMGIEATRRVSPEYDSSDANDANDDNEDMGPLSGMRIAMTGTFAKGNRNSMTAEIEALGGRVVSSVNKSTDVLLVGNYPGRSKLEKAIDLEGCRVVRGSVEDLRKITF